MPVAVDIDHRASEADQVEAWRLRTLLDAGYRIEDAEQLARRGDVDLHHAVDLIKQRGCPRDLAWAILL